MGIILSAYKEAILNDVITSIATGTANYYVFAANPVPYGSGTPTLTYDDYTDKFTNNWQMLFGKKINTTNILPIIQNNLWSSGSIYTQYDNTSNSLYSNTNYYVVSAPLSTGAPYQVYKCIYNANNTASTVQPTVVQQTSFTTSDGYMWRYITSISSQDYNNFTNGNYMPIYANSIVQASAPTYASVDVIVIANSGLGYQTYYNGTVKGGNSSVLQIDSSASVSSNFYNNNSIYVYNNSLSFGQLRNITNYTVNTSGNWVTLNTALTGVSIGSISYNYYISPQVLITSDGAVNPVAYSVVNTVSNSISNIVILNPGSNISWANASIVTNKAFVSSNFVAANIYPIVPPPGGHGFDPVAELQTVGFAMSFSFANTEGNTIPTNVQYNKLGIIKNPYGITSNGSVGNTQYTANTFNQLLIGNTTTTFSVNTVVVGVNSSAYGTVAFSNSTTIYLTGDKYFQNNEVIYNVSNASQNSVFTITQNNGIYSKGINPLYVTNISNINRSNTQTETYKLSVQI